MVGLHALGMLPLRDSAGLPCFVTRSPAFPIVHHASGRMVHLYQAYRFLGLTSVRDMEKRVKNPKSFIPEFTSYSLMYHLAEVLSIKL